MLKASYIAPAVATGRQAWLALYRLLGHPPALPMISAWMACGLNLNHSAILKGLKSVHLFGIELMRACRVPLHPEPVSIPEGTTPEAALKLVLQLPAVGSKRFLTTKVDRHVTGEPCALHAAGMWGMELFMKREAFTLPCREIFKLSALSSSRYVLLAEATMHPAPACTIQDSRTSTALETCANWLAGVEGLHGCKSL